MSRFAVVHEDPDYVDDEAYWEDKFSEWEANQGEVVVKKPHEEYSPFETVNS